MFELDEVEMLPPVHPSRYLIVDVQQCLLNQKIMMKKIIMKKVK
jgi:hypothetical protein